MIASVAFLFVATSAMACSASPTTAEASFLLWVAATTFVVLPAFVVCSVVLCVGRFRRLTLWIGWLLACAILLGVAAWAPVV